jgi:hypothetical protein
MPRNKGQSSTHKKIGWQVICPICVKYEQPKCTPDCELCRKYGVTEDILCVLNRKDQEHDPGDFQCDAYQARQQQQS